MGIRAIKPTVTKTLPNALTSFQIIYLINLDFTTDRVTSRSSEIDIFFCDHKEADTKMFVCIKLLYDEYSSQQGHHRFASY